MFIGGSEPFPEETCGFVFGGCEVCLCDVKPEEPPEEDFEFSECLFSL